MRAVASNKKTCEAFGEQTVRQDKLILFDDINVIIIKM
jgi:hypothetical protein